MVLLLAYFYEGQNLCHTAVVIDGVKVNPINIGNFDFGGLPISNIERIEVLRGEQSALWGSSAMGGVVYITTKSGLYKEKPFNAEVDLGLGSNNTRDASATLSGFHNGFYYALHGDSHRTKGISALSKNHFSYTTETGSEVKTGGASERDGFHRDNGSLRLGYDLGNKGVEVLAAQSSQTVHIDGYNSDVSGEYSRTRNQTFKLGGYWGNEQELLKHQANISQFNSKATHFGSNARYSNEKQLNANYQLDVNFDREGEVTQAVSLLTDYAKTRYTSDKYLREKTLSEKSAALEYRLFTEQDHSFSISGRYTDNSQFKNSITGRISGAYRLSPNLCSDRLLLELAEPQQIRAMSPYSQKPLMMLDKLNTDKPTVEPELTALLPYADSTILLNETFYPQLTARLKQLGFKLVALNDSPQTPEQLFTLILQLGELTQNQAKAEKLVERLRLQKIPLKQPLAETLILSETGMIEPHFPQYQTLLDLLGLSPLKSDLTPQNFSLEKLLLAQPKQLLFLTDNQSYNNQAELLKHPALQKIWQKMSQNPPLVLPMKYTYCFDHGVWQGIQLMHKLTP